MVVRIFDEVWGQCKCFTDLLFLEVLGRVLWAQRQCQAFKDEAHCLPWVWFQTLCSRSNDSSEDSTTEKAQRQTGSWEMMPGSSVNERETGVPRALPYCPQHLWPFLGGNAHETMWAFPFCKVIITKQPLMSLLLQRWVKWKLYHTGNVGLQLQMSLGSISQRG